MVSMVGAENISLPTVGDLWICLLSNSFWFACAVPYSFVVAGMLSGTKFFRHHQRCG
jgi:hypothetical protein